MPVKIGNVEQNTSHAKQPNPNPQSFQQEKRKNSRKNHTNKKRPKHPPKTGFAKFLDEAKEKYCWDPFPSRAHNVNHVNKINKCILLIVTGFLWCTSIILICIGIYVIDTRKDDEGVRKDIFSNYALNFSIILLLIGLVVFVLGLCGCIGVLRENIVLIRLFYVSLIVFLTMKLLLVALVFFFTGTAKSIIANAVTDQLIINYRTNADIEDIMDYMQVKFQCCGLREDGFKDWSRSVYFNCSVMNPSAERCGVPWSCCVNGTGLNNTVCGQGVQSLDRSLASRIVYTRGCLVAVQLWAKRHALLVIVLLLLETCFIVALIFMCTHMVNELQMMTGVFRGPWWLWIGKPKPEVQTPAGAADAGPPSVPVVEGPAPYRLEHEDAHRIRVQSYDHGRHRSSASAAGPFRLQLVWNEPESDGRRRSSAARWLVRNIRDRASLLVKRRRTLAPRPVPEIEVEDETGETLQHVVVREASEEQPEQAAAEPEIPEAGELESASATVRASIPPSQTFQQKPSGFPPIASKYHGATEGAPEVDTDGLRNGAHADVPLPSGSPLEVTRSDEASSRKLPLISADDAFECRQSGGQSITTTDPGVGISGSDSKSGLQSDLALGVSADHGGRPSLQPAADHRALSFASGAPERSETIDANGLPGSQEDSAGQKTRRKSKMHKRKQRATPEKASEGTMSADAEEAADDVDKAAHSVTRTTIGGRKRSALPSPSEVAQPRTSIVTGPVDNEASLSNVATAAGSRETPPTGTRKVSRIDESEVPPSGPSEALSGKLRKGSRVGTSEAPANKPSRVGGRGISTPGPRKVSRSEDSGTPPGRTGEAHPIERRKASHVPPSQVPSSRHRKASVIEPSDGTPKTLSKAPPLETLKPSSGSPVAAPVGPLVEAPAGPVVATPAGHAGATPGGSAGTALAEHPETTSAARAQVTLDRPAVATASGPAEAARPKTAEAAPAARAEVAPDRPAVATPSGAAEAAPAEPAEAAPAGPAVATSGAHSEPEPAAGAAEKTLPSWFTEDEKRPRKLLAPQPEAVDRRGDGGSVARAVSMELRAIQHDKESAAAAAFAPAPYVPSRAEPAEGASPRHAGHGGTPEAASDAAEAAFMVGVLSNLAKADPDKDGSSSRTDVPGEDHGSSGGTGK